MTQSINVEQFEPDKESWFNIKKFKIGNTSFDKPEKSLDANHISKTDHKEIVASYKFKFCETRKVLGNFSHVTKIYEETNDVAINNFFGKYHYSGNLPQAVNLTFNFLPPLDPKSLDALAGFYDHYYSRSNFILTVPNLRVFRHIQTTPLSKPERIRDVTNQQYLNFVDKSVEILDTKNNKPIFVPVSLRISIKEIQEITHHYLKNQYHNFWFDFEGIALNENTLPKLRAFFRILLSKGILDKTVVYFTNVRREIMLNFKDVESPGSVILCAIAGANLIGIDRGTPRFDPKLAAAPKEAGSDSGSSRKGNYEVKKTASSSKVQTIDPRARLLEANTYYYVKTIEKRYDEESKYIAYNSLVLAREFDNQTDYFRTQGKGSLTKFLNNKKMLTSFHDGNVLKKLASKPERTEDTSVFD